MIYIIICVYDANIYVYEIQVRMGYEWRIKKQCTGKVLENQRPTGDKTSKGSQGHNIIIKNKREMRGTTGQGRHISHSNHNSAWSSRCSLPWVFTSKGFYPFIPRDRVHKIEELPEKEEEKLRISWEKSVSYFLFNLIVRIILENEEESMPVEMQVRPHEQDAVNTLEARADIQRTSTRLKNVTNCNLTKLYHDKRSPATMKDNFIPRQFWNRIFPSEI